jgi:hypothetical protein
VIHRPVITERAAIGFVLCLCSLILLKDFGNKFLWERTLVYALCVFEESRRGFGVAITDATGPFLPVSNQFMVEPFMSRSKQRRRAMLKCTYVGLQVV